MIEAPRVATEIHRLSGLTKWPRRLARERAVRRPAAAPRWAATPPVVALVYRRRNAGYVRALLAQAAGAEVRLWALDEVDPELASVTVGCGGGPKFRLVDQLLASSPIPAAAAIVVADDDVVFAKGDLATLIDTGAAAGLGLFQPAHSFASRFNHTVTLAQPGVVASLTGFVEIGPIFVVAAESRPLVVPFGDGVDMGWGLEVEWHRLQRQGLRLGIVDSVRMVHCEPPARAYDRGAEHQRELAVVRAAGYRDLSQLMVRHARWWRTRPSPPWLGSPASSGPGRDAR